MRRWSGAALSLAEPSNYLVVAGEIAVLPLAFGAWEVALVFSVLNALLLPSDPRGGSGACRRA